MNHQTPSTTAEALAKEQARLSKPHKCPNCGQAAYGIKSTPCAACNAKARRAAR